MEADYALTQFAFEHERNSQATAQDDKLIVNFEMLPHLDKDASKKEGRPIFTTREYVTIIIPGDKNTVVRRPVWDMDKRRFPRQYAAFKNGQEQQVTGTPLEQVAWITRSQIEELKFFNVRTLEQLAGIPDFQAQKFMGIQTLKQKAADHIKLAKEQAPLMEMESKLRERDQKIAQQDEQLQQLSAQVEALMKLQEGRSSRKGKAREETEEE